MADLADIIGALLAYYPNSRASEETARLYVRTLADLEPGEVEAAVLAHVSTSPHFPTVAELRSRVFDRRLALPHPDEAWIMASRWAFAPEKWEPCSCDGGYADIDAETVCERCGGTERFPVKTPLDGFVREVLDAMGGKFSLREASNPETFRASNPETFRAQFLRLYEARRKRLIEQTNVDALSGALHELEPSRRRELPERA